MYLPLVSIIIPTFNRSHLICEALDSISSQTYENWECIIVDDGSTDDTEMVVRKYVKKDARFQFHKRPKERLKGGNAARNFGFEISNGKYINWFDDDDVMLSKKIERHLEMFCQNELIQATITNSFLYNFSTKNAYLPWRNQLHTNDLLNDFIRLEAGWQTGDVLWKKETLNRLQFNELLLSSQDWEFHVKAILLDIKFNFDKDCYSHIRNTPKSIKNSHNTNKIISQFCSRKSILEFNENFLKINENGYLYLVEELFGYFRYFVLNKRIILAFQSLKWMIKISLITHQYYFIYDTIIMGRQKKNIRDFHSNS